LRISGIPDGHRTLYGANALLIAIASLWILLRASWFYREQPGAVAAALVGFAVYAWLRFRERELPTHSSIAVALASAGAMLLLYSHPPIGAYVIVTALVVAVAILAASEALALIDFSAFAAAAIWLAVMVLSRSPATMLTGGWMAVGAFWIAVALALRQTGPVRIAGPLPASLPRLLPLFAGGTLLAFVPLWLDYPWRAPMTTASQLLILFVMFFTVGRELAKSSASLVNVGITRVFAVVARLAPIALLAYLAWLGFPAGYKIALLTLAAAAFSAFAAWRQKPRMLTRRIVWLYVAGLFATAGWFMGIHRAAIGGIAGSILDSGALVVLGFVAAALLLRERLTEAAARTLVEIAAFPAIAAAVVESLRHPGDVARAALVGGALLVASAIAFVLVRRPAALFTVPVVLGYWMYVGEWSAGVRGEPLGMIYLVVGIASAFAGWRLLKIASRWFELAWFMWFLCTAVSLALFWPLAASGAYAAALWGVVYLIVARTAEARRDLPVGVALEAISAILAAAVLAVLLWNQAFLPAAFALLIHAGAYAFYAAGPAWLYVYPAALALAGALLAASAAGGRERFFLAWFYPLACAYYAGGEMLRERRDARRARGLELSASAAAAVGTGLFLMIPFGAVPVPGLIVGLFYLALYAILVTGRRPVFFAGAALAGSFAVYQALPLFDGVTAANHLAFFIPVALILVLLGNLRDDRADPVGAWGFRAAAIVGALLASLFSVWPDPASLVPPRVVLLVATAAWVALLLRTRREAFVYLATLTLALLVYNFVQTSADVFTRHVVAFFIAGMLVLGLIFLAAGTRRWMTVRSPMLVREPRRWYRRMAYVLPVTFVAIVTFASWGVTGSSSPHFCGSCHDMRGYFANWQGSAHAQAAVGCDSCHYEPGVGGFVKAKIQGTSELVTMLTGRQKAKPIAEVDNGRCSECHAPAALQGPRLVDGRYLFDHANHLGPLARGPELRCTSCHTDTGAEAHFAVDTNACVTCHFETASPPAPVGRAGCVSCHAVPATGAFDHAGAGVAADDGACAGCHEGMSTGTTAVEVRRCRHCHDEGAAALEAAAPAAVHSKHVTGKGIGCDWCHGVVHHAVDGVAKAD
ncbi:MAG TPA: NapC/NirT family cytochrome c, partial [Thermoanaerobaculia bacterium]